MNLSSKVALVTGSTSGIGLGIARTLAAAGADVLLNGFGAPALIEKLLAELKSQYRVRAALPHNGAVITLLAVTGLTHQESYRDIFAITLLKTAAVAVVIGVFYATGIY